MDPSDDNIQMLLAMGFPSESEVRRALKMAKNDMNEAVDILTNGQALSPYEELPSPVTNQQDGGGGVSHTLFLIYKFLTEIVVNRLQASFHGNMIGCS